MITSVPEISEVIIASYRRKKTVGKRDADFDGLPAHVIDQRLPDEELARLFPYGYKELPDEIYRRLHIIPETFIVDEHHVHVYASKDNDGTIVKAPRGTDLSLLYDRLHELIHVNHIIHADETSVKVMRIDNTKIKNEFIWHRYYRRLPDLP